VGVEAVRLAGIHGVTADALSRLRERLIQRGRHDAGQRSDWTETRTRT
jgi:hypothetical protein